MAYTKQTWADLPSKTTPINASRLGHIEDGIYDAATTADNAAEAIGNLKTAAYKDSTNAVTQSSTDLVESGAVYASVHAVAQDLSDTNLAVAALQTASTNLGKYKAEADSIAPVELDATGASQAYAVDEQFYLNNILMTATSPIAQNDAIVVYPTSGYNCKLSDSVTEQIKAVKDGLQGQEQLLEDTVGWTVGNRNPDNNSHTIVNSSATARSYEQGLVGEFSKGEHYRVTLTLSGISGFNNTGNIRLRILEPDTFTAICTTLTLPDSNGNYVYDIVAENSVSSAFLQIYIRSAETGESATVTISNIVIEHFSVDACKADNSVIGTVEDGTNPTKSYAVDEFMVRDGAFCQVTAPVTTSSTWTEGSNYTKKSIAEVLQSLMS